MYEFTARIHRQKSSVFVSVEMEDLFEHHTVTWLILHGYSDQQNSFILSLHTFHSPTCTTTNSISKHTDEIYFVVILHSTVEHFLFFLLFYVYSTHTVLMLKVDRSLLFLTSVQNGSCSISVVKKKKPFQLQFVSLPQFTQKR